MATNRRSGAFKFKASFILLNIMGGFLGLARNAGAQVVPPATQPSLEEQNRELAARVRELEARMGELETKANEGQARRDTINAVATDAASRSDLIPHASLTAGYAPSVGFVIKSDDGSFSLRPGLVFDARYMTAYRNHIPKGGAGEAGQGGSDTQSGFDITRLRLTLDGTFGKDIGYFLQFQDDQGQAFGLLDAYVTYHFGESPFTFRVGQFKDPAWHERNLSEAKLMAVDRSNVEALLGGGQASRVQGVSLLYSKDRARGQIAIHDGYDSLNTKFVDAGGIGTSSAGGGGVTPANFGVSGRAEYLIVGNRTKEFNPFTEYDQFTSLNAKQDIVVAGGGFDYSQAGSNSVLFHTADVQYNGVNGLGLYGAYLGTYRDLNSNQGVATGSYYDPGFVLQGSYLVTSQIEPFVRYDYAYLAAGSTTGLEKHDTQEITIGANYYLRGQNAKLTLDLGWLPNGAPSDSDALGILKDSGHDEFLARAQFQLAI